MGSLVSCVTSKQKNTTPSKSSAKTKYYGYEKKYFLENTSKDNKHVWKQAQKRKGHMHRVIHLMYDSISQLILFKCLYGFKRSSKEIEIGKPFFRKD